MEPKKGSTLSLDAEDYLGDLKTLFLIRKQIHLFEEETDLYARTIQLIEDAEEKAWENLENEIGSVLDS